MKKSATISRLILMVFFLIPNVILAQKQTYTVNGTQIQVSSTLQKVLSQVETIYLKPISEAELSSYLNRAPVFVPMFIGLVMQRQEMIMRENITSENLNDFTAFEEEIFVFLDQLAEAHNNSSPIDNSVMPSARLKVLYQNALKGDDNAVCKNDFGIDPRTIKTANLLDGFTAIVHGKLIVEDDNEDKIVLFGEIAPAAEIGGNVQVQTELPNRNKSRADSYSGPKQWENLGCQCPQVAPSDNVDEDLSEATAYRYLDCNGDPYDNTYVKCKYSGLGKGKGYYVASQEPISNGEKHGKTYSWHEDVTNGRVYLAWEQNFFNGKEDGIRKIWKLDAQTRQVYLETQEKYVNGKKHGIMIYYSPNGTIRYRSKYNQGKHIENYVN